MSVDRARKALRGEFADCIPFFDTPSHAGFLKKLTGINPFVDTNESIKKAFHVLDIDMTMCELGQTPYKETDGNLYNLGPVSTWRHKGAMRTDMFSYDPSKDRNDFASMSETAIINQINERLKYNGYLVGDVALQVGATFTTCIHYAAEDLEWEDFLMACVTEEDKVGKLLDSFQMASEKIMRAYASVNIEAIVSHDDIAMATGLIQSPKWLRKHLIPRYKQIWKPLKEKGIKILFMTDGNFHEVAEDIADAGADGFFLDQPCMNLSKLVSQCGPDKIYYTGPSPAMMTLGTPEQVQTEISKMAEIARKLPGFFFHMPGGWTHNMRLENVEVFYAACRKYGRRG